MNYLGFYEKVGPALKLTDKKGQARSYLDVFSDVLSDKLSMNQFDKDLVVMKHIFTLQNKQGVKWMKTSEFIKTGEAEAEGGQSIMSNTVGITAGIAARLVLKK